ncbi:MAG: phosphoribosylaminoimidazolesuccinocarboxamide synthase [Thermotogae bacterium]|nr:phosphoribosylaminoimidazolesuccinocarboxamide synthase [Thermotogota bacterium]
MRLLYEGKSKKIYDVGGDKVFVEFKDDITAFNGEKKASPPNKGKITAKISSILFEYLQTNGIPTHYLHRGERGFYARKVKILPVELVVRNVATGSIVSRLGIEKGSRFEPPLVEYFYKSDLLGDPMVCENHIIYFGWANEEELSRMKDLALKATQLLTDLLALAGLRLVDIKYEFGYDESGQLLLADEISPDTFRLWDEEGRPYDKDVFRKDLGDVVETYKEVLRRLEEALKRLSTS